MNPRTQATSDDRPNVGRISRESTRARISRTKIPRYCVFQNGVAASLQTRRQTGASIKAGLKTRLYAIVETGLD
jgi:hypothetical protein